MKEDFYKLLAKHFQGETTAEEDQRIADFKKENALEYDQLQKLWKSSSEIVIHDYDVKSAWSAVSNKFRPNETKVVPLYRNRLVRIATAASLAILVSLSVYLFIEQANQVENLAMIEIQADEGNQKVMLSDGSSVWLDRDAILSYPENFDGDTRLVRLQGKAFFDVVKNPQKAFVVETADAVTSVLGTSFNINAQSEITEVTVATGRVEVASRNNEKVVVTPGYTARLQSESLSAQINDNPNYLSWKTGAFVFDETPLTQVIEDLNTYYNKSISYSEAPSEPCKITAELDKVPIQEILEILELTCDVEIAHRNSTYYIN